MICFWKEKKQRGTSPKKYISRSQLSFHPWSFTPGTKRTCDIFCLHFVQGCHQKPWIGGNKKVAQICCSRIKQIWDESKSFVVDQCNSSTILVTPKTSNRIVFFLEDFTYAPRFFFHSSFTPAKMMFFFSNDAKTMPCPSFRFEVSRSPKIRKLKQLMKFHPKKHPPPWGCAIFPGRSSFLLVWTTIWHSGEGSLGETSSLYPGKACDKDPQIPERISEAVNQPKVPYNSIPSAYENTYTHTEMSHESNDLRQMYIKINCI